MLVLIVLIVIVCLFFCGPAISANDWTTATGFETKDFSYELFQNGEKQYRFTKTNSDLKIDNYEMVIIFSIAGDNYKKKTYKDNKVTSDEDINSDEYKKVFDRYVCNILFDSEKDYYKYTFKNGNFNLSFNQYVTTTEGCYISENKTIVSFDNKTVKSIQKTYLNKNNNKLKTITYVF